MNAVGICVCCMLRLRRPLKRVHAQDYSVDAVVITNYPEDSLENAWCSSVTELRGVCVCVE